MLVEFRTLDGDLLVARVEELVLGERGEDGGKRVYAGCRTWEVDAGEWCRLRGLMGGAGGVEEAGERAALPGVKEFVVRPHLRGVALKEIRLACNAMATVREKEAGENCYCGEFLDRLLRRLLELSNYPGLCQRRKMEVGG